MYIDLASFVQCIYRKFPKNILFFKIVISGYLGSLVGQGKLLQNDFHQKGQFKKYEHGVAINEINYPNTPLTREV